MLRLNCFFQVKEGRLDDALAAKYLFFPTHD